MAGRQCFVALAEAVGIVAQEMSGIPRATAAGMIPASRSSSLPNKARR